MGNNEIYKRKYWFGLLLVHNFWVPDPPPPSSNTSLRLCHTWPASDAWHLLALSQVEWGFDLLWTIASLALIGAFATNSVMLTISMRLNLEEIIAQEFPGYSNEHKHSLQFQVQYVCPCTRRVGMATSPTRGCASRFCPLGWWGQRNLREKFPGPCPHTSHQHEVDGSWVNCHTAW